MQTESNVDFTNWDRLPKAASEIQAYLTRLMAEASITPHDVTARAKSIGSFQQKITEKNYHDPVRQVTDCVAVRIITYSITDRVRAVELIRDRFEVKENEDRNPGAVKPPNLRGYDCHHMVVSGEKPSMESGWLVSGGELSRYFDFFGGLEIQIRTVAAHAWAEFEHARRYKGVAYKSISDQDQAIIDQLFGAASDARRSLDETFVAIEQILASPKLAQSSDDQELGSREIRAASEPNEEVTSVQRIEMVEFLSNHYPHDEKPTNAGLDFAWLLIRACNLDSVEKLKSRIDAVDSQQVRLLMDLEGPVTQVRRLDDDLLACFGENYIIRTGKIGNVEKRSKHLEWRYDRLRGKTQNGKYHLEGTDCPAELRQILLPATQTVREIARVVANLFGAEAATIPSAISSDVKDLRESTRPKEVLLANGGSLWIATNLNRNYSEHLMRQIIGQTAGLDLRVMKDGSEVAPGVFASET